MTPEQKAMDTLMDGVMKMQATAQRWSDAGFPRKTLVVLLAHSTKKSQKDVTLVLEKLDTLIADYFVEKDDD